MQPVRRRVRRHFGLTSKRVAVRSHRPWYFQIILALMFIGLGYGLCYWMLHRDDIEAMRQSLHDKTQENKELETKLVQAQRDLQVELATNNNLAKELASVQDDSLKAKADLFFYKNITRGKR